MLECLSSCLVCQTMQLQQFEYEIHYQLEKRNSVDVPSYHPDYQFNSNKPYKPAQFNILFYVIYPDQGSKEIKLYLNTTSQDSFQQKIRAVYPKDKYLKNLKQRLKPSNWEIRNGLYHFKGKIYISEKLYTELISKYHNKSLADYFGCNCTSELVYCKYQWSKMIHTIAVYTKACQICTQNKYSTYATYSTFLSLPLPSSLWQRIGIDLITDLSKTQKAQNDYIFVVIDHFTKIAYFLLYKKTLNAEFVTDLSIDTIVQHYGIPMTIVSDRNKCQIN